MKLRRVLTEQGPQIEALKPGSTAHWIRLSTITTLAEMGQQFSVKNNLSTCMLSVLELGVDGWRILSEQLDRSTNFDTSHDACVLLPFQPLSFRDFLLFEQHFIDASRGFVKRFFPKKYRITTWYETLTRRTFPKFMPPAVWYQQPLYYFGNHLNFITSGNDIHPPAYTHAIDYELELGAILAKPLMNATPIEAENAIGGYVVLNDFSARDVQLAEMRSGFGPQKAKHFMNAMSATVVTADEINHRVNDLQALVTINDVKRAACTTAGMQYSLGEAIAHASKEERLYVGELFGSGTLPGGCAMENDQWVQSGDLLCLDINAISTLTNRIAPTLR